MRLCMKKNKAKLAGREKDRCKEQERTVNALCLRNMRAIIICKVIITSLKSGGVLVSTGVVVV